VTEALLKMEPKTINRAGVSTALRGVKGFKSDILCKPFYVGDGARHNANSSGPIAQVSGNGFKQVGNGCLMAGDPELSDLREQEKKLGL
jgi:branched-chain amino acid transport system substrate-binding protein